MVNSIDVIYTLLRDYVKYFPVSNYMCKQLQTFAVLDGSVDLNSENLGKSIRDYGKPYFYSRRWENNNFNKSDISFDYPLMLVYQNSYVGRYGTQKESTTKKTYSLEIGVLDKYVQDCLDCRSDYCRDRTNEEIYRDTNVMLDGITPYFNEVVSADIISNEGTYNMYAHKDYFAWLVDQDIISSYTINRSKTSVFEKAWNITAANSNINGYFWKGGIDDLKGTIISLQFQIDVCLEHTPRFFVSKTDGLFLDQNCCG